MNRTRGFVNLNRYKSGRALKRLRRVPDKHELELREAKKRSEAGEAPPVTR